MTSLAPFISITDLSDFLGRAVDTDKATIAVDAACDMTRTEIGQSINLVEDDEVTLDGSGTDVLLLPELPVQAVSAVSVDDEEYEEFVLTSKGLLLSTNGCWPDERQSVVVTFDHGWSETALPRDLRMVTLTAATRIYEQGILSDYSVGDVSVKFAAQDGVSFTPGERRILNRYRRDTA
jgi:hypothetical protein